MLPGSDPDLYSVPKAVFHQRPLLVCSTVSPSREYYLLIDRRKGPVKNVGGQQKPFRPLGRSVHVGGFHSYTLIDAHAFRLSFSCAGTHLHLLRPFISPLFGIFNPKKTRTLHGRPLPSPPQHLLRKQLLRLPLLRAVLREGGQVPRPEAEGTTRGVASHLGRTRM